MPNMSAGLVNWAEVEAFAVRARRQLRDSFAMAALTGLVGGGRRHSAVSVSAMAYASADEMLRVREESPGTVGLVYIVRPGDTLTSIAKLFDLGPLGVAHLSQINRIEDTVEPGWHLVIRPVLT